MVTALLRRSPVLAFFIIIIGMQGLGKSEPAKTAKLLLEGAKCKHILCVSFDFFDFVKKNCFCFFCSRFSTVQFCPPPPTRGFSSRAAATAGRRRPGPGRGSRRTSPCRPGGGGAGRSPRRASRPGSGRTAAPATDAPPQAPGAMGTRKMRQKKHTKKATPPATRETHTTQRTKKSKQKNTQKSTFTLTFVSPNYTPHL